MLGHGSLARRQRRLVLALSSGGVRGFAHIGVMRGLLSAGLRIDALCGASAGALFGALFAMQGTLESLAEAMNVTPREIWGLYRDRLRLAPSNQLGGRLMRHYADTSIESLPIPMSILAVDLESGEEVALRQGSLCRAVEASIAIPLLARPVTIGGRRLIDGGYGRGGPAAAARALDGDVVVYVDLGVGPLLPEPVGRWVRGAMQRMQPPRARRPSAGGRVLARSIQYLATGFSDPPDADVVIAPPLGGVDPNSPFAAATAFRRGEAAARRALPRLYQLLFSDAPPSPAQPGGSTASRIAPATTGTL